MTLSERRRSTASIHLDLQPSVVDIVVPASSPSAPSSPSVPMRSFGAVDVNVTSRDEALGPQAAQGLGPEEALDTMRRRNYPKVRLDQRPQSSQVCRDRMRLLEAKNGSSPLTRSAMLLFAGAARLLATAAERHAAGSSPPPLPATRATAAPAAAAGGACVPVALPQPRRGRADRLRRFRYPRPRPTRASTPDLINPRPPSHKGRRTYSTGGCQTWRDQCLPGFLRKVYSHCHCTFPYCQMERL